MKLRTVDLTFGAVFVCLMAIGANITVWFPFLAIPIGGASVPLSLQTFFAILTGLMLGAKRALMALLTYVLIGIAGVPVFANLQAGPVQLIKPTGGFILSFILVAVIAGWIAEQKKKPSLGIYMTGAIAGLTINYMVGVNYMYLAMNSWLDLEISYTVAWSGMIPFLIKDAGMAVLAAVFMVQISKRLPTHWTQTRTKQLA
ncbi:biotin transporter BioY [Lentibacillus sp. JNUCC-1]|uniref:biotin transporter BioY n=1 Tax=Lentibacillus sp. JNUCC-1 TaxID=2654513 RepID=UPI001E608530|nr:biotin transporter BioY [Lentibacillus sp. JNUCC-1]